MSINSNTNRCHSKVTCGGCEDGSCSDEPPSDEDKLTGPSLTGPPLTGWRFAATSAGCFLGPVVLAILGSNALGTFSGDHSLGIAEGQLLGAIGGLAVGFGTSWVLVRAYTQSTSRSSGDGQDA